MPQPERVSALADPLIAAYERAWRRVLAEQERIAGDPRMWRRTRRLAEVSRAIARAMDGLDRDLAEWIAKDFPRAYLTGLMDTAAVIGAEVTWTAIHQRAVEELAYGIYDDLLEATRYVRGTTKVLIRELAREAGTFSLVGGQTAEQAGRDLARNLVERHGIHAVVYRNGARHGLYDYAEMNLRTTTALGYNRGTLNGAAEVLYWECFDGPGCGWSAHDDTTQALGRIVTRDEALGFPIAHPRCRRSFGPRPDIISKEQIAALEQNPLTVGAGQTTFAQRQAQIAQDRVRSPRGTRAPRTTRTTRAPRSAA